LEDSEKTRLIKVRSPELKGFFAKIRSGERIIPELKVKRGGRPVVRPQWENSEDGPRVLTAYGKDLFRALRAASKKPFSYKETYGATKTNANENAKEAEVDKAEKAREDEELRVLGLLSGCVNELGGENPSFDPRVVGEVSELMGVGKVDKDILRRECLEIRRRMSRRVYDKRGERGVMSLEQLRAVSVKSGQRGKL